MWDLLGFLTSMTLWWVGTFFGTFLLFTYTLRFYAKSTGIRPFINDVNEFCDKFTKLQIGAWIPAYAISAALWSLSIVLMVYENHNFPKIWSVSVQASEKASSYAAWLLIVLLYPASVLLIKFFYAAKALANKVDGEK